MYMYISISIVAVSLTKMGRGFAGRSAGIASGVALKSCKGFANEIPRSIRERNRDDESQLFPVTTRRDTRAFIQSKSATACRHLTLRSEFSMSSSIINSSYTYTIRAHNRHNMTTLSETRDDTGEGRRL